MPAGIGASAAVGFAFETTLGTYVPPTIWIPVLEESLVYTEDKYYSQQLRQQVTDSDVLPSYYHVEGDIRLEVDVNYLPYLMYCSRHTITKTGAGPYTYKFTPNIAGATSTAASGAVQRTASITVLRNGVFFGYTGCTMGGYEFTVSTDEGVLMATMNVMGNGEEDGSGTTSWIAPELFGADCHRVSVDTAGISPAFASPSQDFNGYTFRANHNPEPQNRLIPQRKAVFTKFGKTDFSVESELDFIDKTEYNNFKAAAVKAFQFESRRPGNAVSFVAATEAVRITTYRAAYDRYDINVDDIASLIIGGFEGHGLNITGGDAYAIEVKSPVNIT